MDLTKEELQAAKHKLGPGCMCDLCNRLKNLEDSWILKLGTFFWPHGLNTRDEVKQKVRTGNKNIGG